MTPVEFYIDSNPVCYVNVIRPMTRELFRIEVLFEEILEDNPSITADELVTCLRGKGSLSLIPGNQAWVEVKAGKYSDAHGSPYDRGAADSWYQRPRNPHWYPNGTYNGEEIGIDSMSAQEIAAYHAGYTENEQRGDHKIYN